MLPKAHLTSQSKMPGSGCDQTIVVIRILLISLKNINGHLLLQSAIYAFNEQSGLKTTGPCVGLLLLFGLLHFLFQVSDEWLRRPD